MGNRVEDLEKQVAELQAAVDGLTEELVETKERISQLESVADSPQQESESDSHAEFVPNASATAEASAAKSEGDAQRSVQGESDEANPPESQSKDENEEGTETDDIIVA